MNPKKTQAKCGPKHSPIESEWFLQPCFGDTKQLGYDGEVCALRSEAIFPPDSLQSIIQAGGRPLLLDLGDPAESGDGKD